MLEGEDKPCLPVHVEALRRAQGAAGDRRGPLTVGEADVRQRLLPRGAAASRSRFGEFTVEGLAPSEWRTTPACGSAGSRLSRSGLSSGILAWPSASAWLSCRAGSLGLVGLGGCVGLLLRPPWVVLARIFRSAPSGRRPSACRRDRSGFRRTAPPDTSRLPACAERTNQTAPRPAPRRRNSPIVIATCDSFAGATGGFGAGAGVAADAAACRPSG